LSFGTSIPSTFNFILKFNFPNGSNYNLSLAGKILKKEKSYIHLPSYSISTYPINNSVRIDSWSNNTSSIKIYVNGIYNKTVTGNISDSSIFTGFSSGMQNFSIEVKDPSGSIFNTKSFSIEIQKIMIIDFTFPSVIVSYPRRIFENETKYVEIETTDSASIDVTISINMLSNTTSYAGNQSMSIEIPSFTAPANATFDINVFDSTGDSWKNISILIEILQFIESFDVISVEYTVMSYINSTISINGTATFPFNVTITRLTSKVYEQFETRSFLYDEVSPSTGTDLKYQITIERGGVIIYYREITVTVVKRPTVGLTETDPWQYFVRWMGDQWLLASVAAVAIPVFFFVINKQKRRYLESRPIRTIDENSRISGKYLRRNKTVEKYRGKDAKASRRHRGGSRGNAIVSRRIKI
jgi:hypothetical protein